MLLSQIESEVRNPETSTDRLQALWTELDINFWNGWHGDHAKAVKRQAAQIIKSRVEARGSD